MKPLALCIYLTITVQPNLNLYNSAAADSLRKVKADIGKIVLLMKKYGFKKNEVEGIILNKLKENE